MLTKRVRHQDRDLEWQPTLSTQAPTRPGDEPARFRGLRLQRRARSRPEGLPASTWIIVVVLALAIVVAVGHPILATG